MTERCAACGADVEDGAARCLGCGLSLTPAADGADLAASGVPRDVEFYLGEAPRTVAAPDDGAPVEVETPVVRRPPTDTRVVRRRWIVAAVVIAVVAAAVVSLIRAHRPDDVWTHNELAYERFLSSDGLRPVDFPDAVDPDARIIELGHQYPDALRTATAAHRPLPSADGLTLHAFFDAFLERLLDVSPDSAFRLGVHPHPAGVTGEDAVTKLRLLMLCADTSRALRAWPDAARLSAHDRADREALLGWVELQLRWKSTRDMDLLNRIALWFEPLVHLAEIECCPAQERIEAATARLRALPAHLLSAAELLKTPPHALVLSTAARLDDTDAYLATYADSWRGAPNSAVASLRQAIGPAREAVTECARRLRLIAVSDATGSLAVGPENVAVVLRVYHRLPLDARTVYQHALDELREAHDELRRLASPRPSTDRPVSHESDETQIAGLRGAAAQWLPEMPHDDGLVVKRMPKLDAGRGDAASYMDSGTLGPAAAGVIHVVARQEKADFGGSVPTELRRRHALAHETYPGHRMEALLRRSACPLRRFIDDRVFVEGWAVYAEDLLHETDGCAGGSADASVRAERRATRAYSTMVALLIATGAATDDEVLGLLQVSGWSRAKVEDLGARHSSTLYALTYFLGREEVVRFRDDEERRLGAAFDLRAFHAKLLSSGPIPPRLIEEEWGDAH